MPARTGSTAGSTTRSPRSISSAAAPKSPARFAASSASRSRATSSGATARAPAGGAGAGRARGARCRAASAKARTASRRVRRGQRGPERLAGRSAAAQWWAISPAAPAGLGSASSGWCRERRREGGVQRPPLAPQEVGHDRLPQEDVVEVDQRRVQVDQVAGDRVAQARRGPTRPAGRIAATSRRSSTGRPGDRQRAHDRGGLARAGRGSAPPASRAACPGAGAAAAASSPGWHEPAPAAPAPRRTGRCHPTGRRSPPPAPGPAATRGSRAAGRSPRPATGDRGRSARTRAPHQLDEPRIALRPVARRPRRCAASRRSPRAPSAGSPTR